LNLGKEKVGKKKKVKGISSPFNNAREDWIRVKNKKKETRGKNCPCFDV
jgi:hypothetical protein